jgi:hypothetical protein
MNAISEVIQGSESSLFDRVYSELQKQGVSDKCLKDFEKYRNAEFDVLLEASEKYLTCLGYWV